MPSLTDGRRGVLTSFYSWRLIFKTFLGEPHDQEHYEAAHESPLVMTIPLAVLAFGSLFAGFPFKEFFAGHGVEEFFRESVKMNPHIIEEMHHIPHGRSRFLPTVMMVLGFAVAYHVLHPPAVLPVELARQQPAALSVPAQQMVFRRAVRLHLRAAGQVARPLPVEAGRRLA